MTIEECVKGLKYLSIAYGTQGYTKEESKIYYDFLKKYDYEIYKMSIKNIIKQESFVPKINKIIEECEKNEDKIEYMVIEKMKEKGYFKNDNEYEKTINFVKNGTIPEWLKKDIKKYYEDKTILLTST